MLLQILTSQLNFTLPCILILWYCWIRFSLCLIPCNKSIDAITLFWKRDLTLHWNIFLSHSVNMNDNNKNYTSLLPPCDVHNLILISSSLHTLSQKYLQIYFANTTSVEYVYSIHFQDEIQVRAENPHRLGWVWDIL